MYLALVLMPWMLIYGISTILMNHRAFFKEHYGGSLVKWVKETEQPYGGKFSTGAGAPMMAEQILRDLHLEGNYNANLRKASAPKLTIVRNDLVTPRRITYTPGDGNLLIEKQEFRTQPLFERLHRRRGYTNRYMLDTAWAVSVDAAIVGIVFWVASGLWMWWELKVTRRTGVICALAGLAAFTFFLFTI
jgi:hypothetical protein